VHPRLFQFGHLVLPTYGVLVAAGMIASLLVLLRVARFLLLDTDKIWNLALLAIVMTSAGVRLLPVLANWRQYGAAALAINFGGGSSAFLGGIAMAAIACFLYARRTRLPIRRSADALAPSLALTGSIVSIGCLEAGCGFGTPTNAPWAIVFTSTYAAQDVPLGIPLQPTQIYASIAQFAIFALLLWLIRRPHHDGEIMGTWLFVAGIANFFLAFLRGDGGGAALLGGLVTVGQSVAAAMVVFGGWLWLRRAEATQAPHAG
jgi:phosphatidylglycerol---prolipoprotein diacylglyceryl transferase